MQKKQEQQAMPNIISRKAIVPDLYAGKRLDKVLSQIFHNYSRSQFQKLLQQGQILVNGIQKKPKNKVFGGENIDLSIPIKSDTKWEAEAIPIERVYEDHDIIVVNKPDNLVVHPGAGNLSGTLSNALLAYDKVFCDLPRAGIVHRLDKNTSGLMVVAKTLTAQKFLVQKLSEHQVRREYKAIVTGHIYHERTIITKINRNPYNRLKMAVTLTGKVAVTHIKPLVHYRSHTLVNCILETGRTHQIRVHMKYINSPLLGDTKYNSRYKIPKRLSKELEYKLRHFKRQALHAYKLGFLHPVTLKTMSFMIPFPQDMKELIQILEKDSQCKKLQVKHCF